VTDGKKREEHGGALEKRKGVSLRKDLMFKRERKGRGGGEGLERGD